MEKHDSNKTERERHFHECLTIEEQKEKETLLSWYYYIHYAAICIAGNRPRRSFFVISPAAVLYTTRASLAFCDIVVRQPLKMPEVTVSPATRLFRDLINGRIAVETTAACAGGLS